ncbi:MAG: branched-chain amino acid ABC transporter permease [Candidatus Caldarchaeum sp.]|uniref:Branched-chain amino acid ABC transporter permease n=1 Tax=Caldiarchaeum subterraneum TaxID=311458 RepID=A0A7C5L7M0_CALS0
MVVFEPILRDAVIFASMLSLLSLGLTLNYLTTKVPNFAHGSFASIGMMTMLTMTEVFKLHAYISIIPAFLLGGGAALVLYLIVLRPLISRDASLVSQMIATIAFELILIAVLNIYADYFTQTFKIQSRGFLIRRNDVRIFDQPGVFLAAPALAVSIVIVLHMVLTKTRFGVGLRAAIENPPLAGSLGINVKRMYSYSWFIAGGLGGLAGSLLALWFQGSPDYGSLLLISIFAASIVGGLQNIYGAVAGGYLLGFIEILGTRQLGITFGAWITVYRPLIPLMAMALTLIIAPQGLLAVRWRGLGKLLVSRGERA